VVFVQEHGGKDLESFALLNFDEARALLVQVCYTCFDYGCTCWALKLGMVLIFRLISVIKYRLRLGLLWLSLRLNLNIEIFTGGSSCGGVVIYAVIVFARLLIYEYPIVQGKYTCGPKWFWNVAVHSRWQDYVGQNSWINNIYYWLHFIKNKHRWALEILALVCYRVLNLSPVIINCLVHTGDSILYLDLSSDPDLFKGPKGDKQVRNTYLDL